METLEILKYPQSELRDKSLLLKKIGQKEKELFEQMLYTMRYFSGVGLAAVQVGILKRMVVADTGEGVLKIANPKIVKSKGAERMEEGCLSVPNTTVEIERAREIVVTGLNEKGKSVELKLKGLLARVLQHEIDHLDGKLIVDYMDLSEKLRLGIR